MKAINIKWDTDDDTLTLSELPNEIEAYSDLYCDKDGYPMVFRCRQDALEQLEKDGVTSEQMRKMRFVSCIGRCFRCGGPLFPSFLPEYTSQCFDCDEDFYGIEQKTKA